MNSAKKILALSIPLLCVVALWWFQIRPIKASQYCPNTWEEATRMTQEDRARCARFKEQSLLDEQYAAEKTAAALRTQRPIKATPTVPSNQRLAATPTPTTPPISTLPESMRRIEDITGTDTTAQLKVLNGMNSVWHVSVVPTFDEFSYGYYFVWASPKQDPQFASLGTYVLTNSAGAADTYDLVFELPKDVGDVGDITITNVTAPDGIVSFTTSSGREGTFNLHSKEWVFSS